jgi:hypothetical protein
MCTCLETLRGCQPNFMTLYLDFILRRRYPSLEDVHMYICTRLYIHVSLIEEIITLNMDALEHVQAHRYLCQVH